MSIEIRSIRCPTTKEYLLKYVKMHSGAGVLFPCCLGLFIGTLAVGVAKNEYDVVTLLAYMSATFVSGLYRLIWLPVSARRAYDRSDDAGRQLALCMFHDGYELSLAKKTVFTRWSEVRSVEESGDLLVVKKKWWERREYLPIAVLRLDGEDADRFAAKIRGTRA